MKLSETGTEMRQHVDGNVVTLVVTQKVASAFRKLFEYNCQFFMLSSLEHLKIRKARIVA